MPRSVGALGDPTRAGVRTESSERTGVTFLGHASVLLEAGGERIIADPVFAPRIGRIFTKRSRPFVTDPGALGEVSAVLISHGHHDHLDYPSLRRLGLGHPVVVPWGLATALRWHGFTDVRVIRPWTEVTLGRWRVTAVPSRHFGGRLPFPYTSGHQGYVLSGPNCIYFAGDSGLDPEMFREIGRRFQIDLALLPIAGAVFPWFRRNHMNADDALRALECLGAERMVPIHFETYPASFEPAGEARRRLAEESARLGAHDRIIILAEGERIVLPGAGSRNAREAVARPPPTTVRDSPHGPGGPGS